MKWEEIHTLSSLETEPQVLEMGLLLLSQLWNPDRILLLLLKFDFVKLDGDLCESINDVVFRVAESITILETVNFGGIAVLSVNKDWESLVFNDPQNWEMVKLWKEFRPVLARDSKQRLKVFNLYLNVFPACIPFFFFFFFFFCQKCPYIPISK